MHNCSWCGKPLPEDAKENQRFHEGKCRNEKGRQLRIGRYGNADPIKHEIIERLCAWCGKSLPKNSPSAKKYHDGLCRENGYKETNARNSRSYRFRREMGIARRK